MLEIRLLERIFRPEDVPENYSLVTYTLDKTENGTSLSLKQKGFADEEAQAHADRGWAMVLQNLKELLKEDKPGNDSCA